MTMMVQDGEGDGEISRKGTSVIHYDQQFREEVVAFAKATSRKEAKERCQDYPIKFSSNCFIVQV